MNRIVLLFFFLVFGYCSFAQFSLSGKIVNISGVSFTYCKLVLSQDSIIVQTTDADSTGRYRFSNLQQGRYGLEIKVPFKSVDTIVELSETKEFDLSIDDGGMLDAIVVSAKQSTIIRKADRTIFNPANIPMLVGGDATDVIQFAPGVFIQGDQITVQGGTPASVLLNDKLIKLRGAELISFIRSIPVEDIQYIEIIPIPPVKYAASVSGSLINIRLIVGSKSRHSKGSVSAGGSQHFYFQPNAQASYSFRARKFSLYSNISAYSGKSNYSGTQTIEYDSLNWKDKTHEVFRYSSLNSGLGLNYEWNKSTEIGMLAVVSTYRPNSREENLVALTDPQMLTFKQIMNSTSNKYQHNDLSLNLNVTKRLDSTGRKLDFNVDYTRAIGNRSLDFITRTQTSSLDSLSIENTRGKSQGDFLSGGIDYVHPFKKLTWNLGGRYSYGENKSNLEVYNVLLNPTVPDTTRTNAFRYLEHIQALYTSLEWKVKKWSFQIGFRGENTYFEALSPTTNIQVKRNYFQWEAKLYALYEMKNGNTMNFSYTRSFNRPNYSYFNPFPYYSSKYAVSTGNPYVKPMILQHFQATFNVKDFRFSTGWFYMGNMYADFTRYNDSTQLQETRTYNLFTSNSLDVSVAYYKLVAKRLLINATVAMEINNRKMNEQVGSQNLLVYSGYTYVTIGFVLDKKNTFNFNTSFSYSTPHLDQVTLKWSRPYFDLELKKTFLNNRIVLKLESSDPFRWQRTKSKTISGSVISYKDFYYDSQSIGFSFTYKFGNKRLNINEHSTNATGEAGRGK
jgi:hypothetical protein